MEEYCTLRVKKLASSLKRTRVPLRTARHGMPSRRSFLRWIKQQKSLDWVRHITRTRTDSSTRLTGPVPSTSASSPRIVWTSIPCFSRSSGQRHTPVRSKPSKVLCDWEPGKTRTSVFYGTVQSAKGWKREWLAQQVLVWQLAGKLEGDDSS
jgi:hypothetical protein